MCEDDDVRHLISAGGTPITVTANAAFDRVTTRCLRQGQPPHHVADALGFVTRLHLRRRGRV
jgi:hypothetical protein